jgi:FHS family L-fucose permease-like MFS transporter
MLILSGVVMSADQLAKLPAAEQLAYRATEAAMVQGPYLGLAAALVCLALFFAFARLPRISHDESAATGPRASLLAHRHLVLGAIGIFAYVGGEVAIGSFLINFMGEGHIAGLSLAQASPYVAYYWGGAMVGRFIGFAVMRKVSPGRALAFNAACSIALILVAVFGHGPLAMWSLLAVGLCNSIMFPTIFSMALHKLGPATGQGSGLLCMAIVGGAVLPFIQGAVADTVSLQLSFLVPAACYVYILYYGVKYANLYRGDK